MIRRTNLINHRHPELLLQKLPCRNGCDRTFANTIPGIVQRTIHESEFCGERN